MSTDALSRTTTTRLSAGLLLRDPAGEILLVKQPGHEDWDLPGGPVHEHESPAAACTRQAAQELELRHQVSRLLVVDWATHFHVGDEVLWIFDGGRIAESDVQRLHTNRAEIAEAAFWPPAIMTDVMPERLARRLELAVTAADGGGTIYSENGLVVAQNGHGAMPLVPQQPADA